MRFIYILFFVIAVFISSCEENPTEVGKKIIEENTFGDVIGRDTLDSYSDNISVKSKSFIGPELSFNYNSTNYAGRIVDQYTESKASLVMMLISYLSDTTYVTALKNGSVIVESARFVILPKSTIGNEDDYWDIDVHPLTSVWNGSSGIKKTDMDTLCDNSINMKTGPIEKLNDSLYTFPVDKQIMTEWLYTRADDSLEYKYKGVVFTPKSGTKKMLGFNSSDSVYMPRIEVFVRKTAGADLDTVVFYPKFEDAMMHVVTYGQSSFDIQNIVLQGGIPIRSYLFFDYLKQLPEDIIINKAVLELTIDTLKAFKTNNKIEAVYVSALSDSLDISKISESSSSSELTREKNKFIGNITSIIDGQNYSKINFGFLLSVEDEIGNISRDMIYSESNPDPEKRPKLTIYYTKKN